MATSNDKDPRILRLKTPAECEQFAKNCEERGHRELAIAARRRALALRAEMHNATTAAERDALVAIYAYEDLLTAKNGRTTKASRTWQMIERHGIIGAIERAVNRSEETAGHSLLREMGYGDLAFEAVVLRYPDLFSAEARRYAQKRMEH